MRKAIFASFLHVASSESNNYHAQCNISWCQSQRDSANKTNLYKPGVGLSASVIKLVKTQNQNESFNSMISERVPKITYVGKDILDFAISDAAANFNDGR